MKLLKLYQFPVISMVDLPSVIVFSVTANKETHEDKLKISHNSIGEALWPNGLCA